MRSEVERKIAEYAAKLENLNGPDDKRIKKRVLQALGKLKKELSTLDAGGAGVDDGGEEGGGGDGNRESEDKIVKPELSRKHLKAKLKLLNKELTDYAQKKQLKTAVKRFSWGVRKGMEPDKHTYANLLNCYVRCGDLDGALLQFKAMNDAKIAPNIVIYTTLLKGYCDKGDLAGAQQLLFSEMPKHQLVPGIRTINTFIRGCTKLGAVTSAMRAYHLLHSSKTEGKPNTSNTNNNNNNSNNKKRKRPASDDNDEDDDDEEEPTESAGPDGNIEENGQASLFESIVALLCQSLDVEQASVIAVQALETAKGKHNEAEKWVECATSALESSKSSILRNSMQLNREQNQIGENNDNKDGKRSRSVDLFLRHRRAELEGELENLTEALQVIRSSYSYNNNSNNNSTSSNSNSKINTAEIQSRIGLFQSLSRVLQFGYNGYGDFDNSEAQGKMKNKEEEGHKKDGKDDKKVGNKVDDKIISTENKVELTTKLIFALRDKFGLDKIQKKNVSPEEKEEKEENDMLMKMKNEVVKKVLRCVSSESGYINYSELFSSVAHSSHLINENAEDEEEEEDEDEEYNKSSDKNRLDHLPVNIEICSGSGEWVVAHASADLYYSHKGPKADNNDKNDKNGDKNKNNKNNRNDKDSNDNNNAVPRALWLALELRCDRVYHTVSRSVLENIVQHSHFIRDQTRNNYHDNNTSTNNTTSPSSLLSFTGLSNLAVIGGDASTTLPNRIAPCSITSVYINHPEPPERTGGVGDSEGKHLLTQPFFTEIHRILKTTGTCTIVTDNLPYAKSLLQALAKTTKNTLESTDSSLFPCFISVPLDSIHDNDKSDKRILEEEIVVGGKSVSSEVIVRKERKESKKNKERKMMGKMSRDSDSDDNSDEGEGEGGEEGGGDEDSYAYENDEDAMISDNIASSSGKKKVPFNEKNKQNLDRSIPNKKGGKGASGSTLIGGEGPGISTQVLQLWRGDSAEVDGNNDNNNRAESVHASSYFDRMWERGQKKRRWFMVLKKY